MNSGRAPSKGGEDLTLARIHVRDIKSDLMHALDNRTTSTRTCCRCRGLRLRASLPLPDQTLHAAHGRAARVVQRVCEVACERHEALEARQLAGGLGAPLHEDTLEAAHHRTAARQGQPALEPALEPAGEPAGELGVRWGAAEDGLGLEHLQQPAQHAQAQRSQPRAEER